VAFDGGAILILNRSGSTRNQTYVAGGASETRLDVTPTGSSGGRHDLAVVRIRDLQYAPWSGLTVAPADRPTFRYAEPFIIQNVPAGTSSFASLNLGYSGYALARLEIPANTSVITNAMIKDLRKLAQPRSSFRQYGGSPGIGAEGAVFQVGTIESGDPYSMAPLAGVQPTIEIPSWATHMDISGVATGLIAGQWQNPAAYPDNRGATLIKVGTGSSATNTTFGPHINWDAQGGDSLFQLTATDTERAIPTAMRGTSQKLTMRVRLDAGRLVMTQWSTLVFTVAFYERVV
jgi:hypothetical protein